MNTPRQIPIDQYFRGSYGLPVAKSHRTSSTSPREHGNSDAGEPLNHSVKLSILSMLHEAEALVMRDDRMSATNLVENVANIIRPRQ